MEMNLTAARIAEFPENTYTYVDIRGETAFLHGHIPGAVCWNEEKDTAEMLPSGKLIIYCSHGEQSAAAAKRLREQGYEAYNLSGGYRQWLLHNYEELSDEELKRYDRQILLPQIGIEGQKKLKKSSVLIVGAGGLGAPAALYLAGAGVGKIGIVDGDVVSISNLQRQIVHSMETENINKAESARQTLLKLNDRIEVKTYPIYLDAENAESIMKEYDFVIDAADNFETKFLINDACVLNKKAFCHAGILQFEGQVMTWVPGEFPCYRCVFGEIPKSGTVKNCSQAGVFGAVAGIAGSLQAVEAVKYLLNTGELLTGKMFVINALTMETRIVDIKKKNKNCRVCGSHAAIKNIRENAEEYRRNSLCR